MNLFDAITNLSGSPAEIPDCSRDDLPEFFVQMGYKVGAEIGVDKGEFTVSFCKAGLSMYAIDPWGYYPGYEDSRGYETLNQLYEDTKRLLIPYPNCKVIRKTSMEAALEFPDESLDFVYIDGNHEFQFVADDVCVWSKKVKKGGVISGHDYIHTNPKTQAGVCHVIYVVDAYTKAYKIKNWYLLGNKHKKIDNEKRDRFRSWMWIKDYSEPFYPIK